MEASITFREFHVIIIGACSPFGRLVFEYFARNVRKNLSWAISDFDDAEMQEVMQEFRLPTNSHVIRIPLNLGLERSDMIKKTHTIINCLPFNTSDFEIALSCASEGTNYIGILEDAALLNRMKSLDFLAKRNNCSIIPTCTTEITMSELGLLYLSNQFSPGQLLEASIFSPLANDYRTLINSSACYASKYILDSKKKKEIPRRRIKRSSYSSNSLDSLSPPSIIDLKPSTPVVKRADKQTTSEHTFNGNDIVDLKNSKSNELDSSNSTSKPIISKTRSYDDIDNADKPNISKSPNNTRFSSNQSSGSYSKSSVGYFQSLRSFFRLDFPPLPRYQPSKCTIVKNVSEAENSHLWPSNDTVLSTALSSTAALPSSHQSFHKIENWHITSDFFNYYIFLIVATFLILVFHLLPFVHKKVDSYHLPLMNNPVDSTTEGLKSRLRYYIKTSPTTMTPSAIKYLDPYEKSKEDVSSHFNTINVKKMIVGGKGTRAAYLASSSNQPGDKLKFVEVLSPQNIGNVHSSVICVSLLAITLSEAVVYAKKAQRHHLNSQVGSHGPHQVDNFFEKDYSKKASYGVIPPLTAGGKPLKEKLLVQGFFCRSVSFKQKPTKS